MQPSKQENGGGLLDCAVAEQVYQTVQLSSSVQYSHLIARGDRHRSAQRPHRLLCGKVSSSQEVGGSHQENKSIFMADSDPALEGTSEVHFPCK